MVNTIKKTAYIYWRDVIAILTILMIAASLVLISYGINRNNEIARDSSKQIDCIAKFFSQPNRQGLTITNVDSCTIKR